MQAGYRSSVHGGVSYKARVCAVVGASLCEARHLARAAGREKFVSIATTSGCQVRQ